MVTATASFIFVIMHVKFHLRYSTDSCRNVHVAVTGSVPDEVLGVLQCTESFQSHYGPTVDPAYSRNNYQKFFL
jgi:hypothetical protein